MSSAQDYGNKQNPTAKKPTTFINNSPVFHTGNYYQ